MGDLRSMLITGAAVGAAAVGGAAIANAATSSTGSSTSSTTPQMVQTNPRSNVPPPGTFAHESAEKAVTGVAASKARAAAVRAAGGGKAGEVTTDYSGNGYEVTVTKSDGSKTEIHLDESFNALSGRGGRHGGPHCAAGSAGPSSTGSSEPSGSDT